MWNWALRVIQRRERVADPSVARNHTRRPELGRGEYTKISPAYLRDGKFAEQARLWLRVQLAKHGDDLKLAIGGPRESEAPGIYG